MILAKQHNQIAWLAWHVAALSRSKQMPSLGKISVKIPAKPKPRQTPEQQMAIAKMWASVGAGVMRFPSGKVN